MLTIDRAADGHLTLPPEWGDATRSWFEERAAILEFEGGNSREDAEIYAVGCVVASLPRSGVATLRDRIATSHQA